MNFPPELKFTESQKDFLISKFPENIFIGEVKNSKFRLNNKLMTEFLKEDLFKIATKLNLQVTQKDSKKDLWSIIEKKAMIVKKNRIQKMNELNKLFESCEKSKIIITSESVIDSEDELINNFDEMDLFGEMSDTSE